MAETSQGSWRCSNCHHVIDRKLPVCPHCQKQRPPDQWPELPSNDDTCDRDLRHGEEHDSHGGHLTSVSRPAGGTEQHHGEVQRRVEQQRAPNAQRLPIQCPKCGVVPQTVANFCPNCGTQLSAHDFIPKTYAATVVQGQVQAEQVCECYYCRSPLKLGDKKCSQCRKPQPDPKGPPCIHGCGVRLIFPGAKACARCGNSQQARTPMRQQPTDSIYAGYTTYGYGYPNNPMQQITGMPENTQQFGPQQFGPGAYIQTPIPISQPPQPEFPHPNSGHAQAGGDDRIPGPNKAANSPSTAGTGGSFPTGSKQSHPHGAWSSTVEPEGSGKEGNAGLEKPIQETNRDSHLIDAAANHPLQPDNHEESTKSRKRKKASDSDDSGKSKQSKVDKNDKNPNGAEPLGDNSLAPNPPATTEAANVPSVTTADFGAPITTTTTTAASSSTTTTTTTTTTGSNKELQVSAN